MCYCLLILDIVYEKLHTAERDEYSKNGRNTFFCLKILRTQQKCIRRVGSAILVYIILLILLRRMEDKKKKNSSDFDVKPKRKFFVDLQDFQDCSVY